MIYGITAAFCPVAQLARMLTEYNISEADCWFDKHIIVNCHYPINYQKNQTDLKVLMDSYCFWDGNVAELWDPESDIGSAQSQNWVLDKLSETLTDDDFFVNLDPDAACRTNWIRDAKRAMAADPKLVVVSCNAPMVGHFIETRHQEMLEKEIDGVKLLLPDIPTPFNLSLWRYSFIRDLGGIPQQFPMYGEVEGPVFASARANGYYTAYLKDHMENEDGKLMHDEAFQDWKDAHARKHTFLGTFREYCELKGLL